MLITLSLTLLKQNTDNVSAVYFGKYVDSCKINTSTIAGSYDTIRKCGEKYWCHECWQSFLNCPYLYQFRWQRYYSQVYDDIVVSAVSSVAAHVTYMLCSVVTTMVRLRYGRRTEVESSL